MPDTTNSSNRSDGQRVQLAEDVKKLLYEGMKKAEQTGNWDLFQQYAHYYIKMVG